MVDLGESGWMVMGGLGEYCGGCKDSGVVALLCTLLPYTTQCFIIKGHRHFCVKYLTLTYDAGLET